MVEKNTTQRDLFGSDAAVSDRPPSSSPDYQKWYVDRKKAAGICARCKESAVEGKQLCERHRQAERQKRINRRARGQCLWCSSPTIPGRVHCARHQAIARERARKRARLNKCRRCKKDVLPSQRHCEDCLRGRAIDEKTKREERKRQGICTSCGGPKDGYVQCADCRAKLRARYIEFKTEVMNAYGGCICRCCGETRVELLTLDHPDGDGVTHRKLLGGKRGPAFYKMLQKAGYPNKPRLVPCCFNCNLSKNQFGVCVHELERRRGLTQTFAPFVFAF